MKDTDLIAALRQLKINTGSIACLGCEHENGCSIHGCLLIGMAADTIEKYSNALDSVKKLHGASNGNTRKVLSDALAFFDRYYGPEPELPRTVCDFEVCYSEDDLAAVMQYINHDGYRVLSVTQNGEKYTVFFSRPAQD